MSDKTETGEKSASVFGVLKSTGEAEPSINEKVVPLAPKRLKAHMKIVKPARAARIYDRLE